MNPHRKERNLALRKIAEHRAKRAYWLAREKAAGNAAEKAAEHLDWIRRWRERAQDALAALRKSRGRAPCPRAKLTYRSVKNWATRPRITPRLIVLHSTESDPLSGRGVSNYLSHGGTQADAHVVIDTNGAEYRLVPDGRKAWTQAAYNSVSLSIEQVGRASVDHWPEPLLRATARRIACWSRKYNIPIRPVGASGRGVTTHKQLGAAGGGHVDPGPHYPLTYVLKLAQQYAD